MKIQYSGRMFVIYSHGRDSSSKKIALPLAQLSNSVSFSLSAWAERKVVTGI